MPQTRFVLKKALEQNLTPIVVVNKIDRDFARPTEVVDEVLDLFIELDADEEQLDFPVIYASAINGQPVRRSNKTRRKHAVVYDTIIENIPAPVIIGMNPSISSALLDYSDFVGRIGIGRVFRGTMQVGNRLL